MSLKNITPEDMKEEEKLLAKCGRKNPFRVPEGYFSEFSDKLMEQLPQGNQKNITVEEESPKITLFTRIKPYLYMAALFCGTILMVKALMDFQQRAFPQETAAVEETLSDEELDHFMSSPYYDEYVLYSYLTEEQNY